MKVYENEFIKILFHAQESIIEVVWKKESFYMLDSDYKDCMLRYRDICLELKPQKALHLSEDAERGFTIAPELQEWTSAEIGTSFAAHGVCKYIGLVMSKDLFTQFSVKQTVEEIEKANNIKHQFFPSREEAWNWLVSVGNPEKSKIE